MEPWQAKLEQGDTQGAWNLFAERYRRLMLATIRRLVTDHDDVMDVFSTVCESLSANDSARLRSYTQHSGHRASVATWLVVVVRNRTIDWLRQHDARRQHDVPLPETIADSSPDAVESRELVRNMADALASQPPDVRLAVELFVIDGVSAGDVARAVGWPNAKAVYNRVYRALDSLRDELKRRGIGSGDL